MEDKRPNNCKKYNFFSKVLKLLQLLFVQKALFIYEKDEEIIAIHAYGCVNDAGDGSKKHYRKSS